MDPFPAAALARARTIEVMCLDVDGVLTDGRLTYGSDGTETKSFFAQDGAALKMLIASGVAVAIVTGRRSDIVTRRARELGITHVHQGVADKAGVVDQLVRDLGTGQLAPTAIAHAGDDIADLALFDRVGLKLAVPNAHPEVLMRAHYVTRAPAGGGAVREMCHLVMTAQGTWTTALGRAQS